MPAGMALADREDLRSRIREEALARAALTGLTFRCQLAIQRTDQSDPLTVAEHLFCRGEEPGNAGCLCICHDIRARILAIGET